MSDDESQGMRRSRRSRAKNSKTADALEKLKQVRKEGKVHRENVEVPDLYDEVDEEEYAEKYGGDGFVVDDDGSGYVDNGEDDEEEGYGYVEDEKEKKKKDRRAGKVKKGGLHNFFSAVAPARKEAEQIINANAEEELNKLLAEVDGCDNILDAVNDFHFEEEYIPDPSTAANDFDNEYIPAPSTAANDFEEEYIPAPRNNSKRKFSPDLVKITPPAKLARIDVNSDTSKTEHFPETKLDDFNDEEDCSQPTIATDFNMSKTVYFPETKLDNFDDEEDCSQPTMATDSDISKTGYFPEKQSLQFYWFDSYEDFKQPGKVYLFGFIKKNDVMEFESCCVIIEKICHRVYFVPRDTHLETNKPINPLMVYSEVNELLSKDPYKVQEFKSRAVEKKFAFMDGTPTKATCLEVCYDSSYPALPAGPYQGKTFNRIANASVTAMERLLVERNIKGPCWLDVNEVHEVSGGDKVSFCNREFKATVLTVELNLVKALPNMQNDLLPPCKMVALNILTVACPKTNKPHIVMVSILRTTHYYLDRRTPTKWDQKITYVSPPPGATLPFQFQQDVDRRKLPVQKCPNEKALLQNFLGSIKQFDPDVVVGHDIAAQLSILRTRLEDNGLNNVTWSFMGRLKRKDSLKHAPQNKNFRWMWTAGRLYLDSKSAAMELMHSQSYDLDELVAKILLPLDPHAQRLSVDTDVIARVFYENGGKTEPIFNLAQWSLTDAQFSHRILAQLNAMQLFLQITQIVGGVLSRTLMGGRAERNEYLLLHAFFREGFVAPDKIVSKFKTKQMKQEANSTTKHEDGTEEAHPQQQQQTSSKKSQYTGGLVLEPKKGLYDTFIVLLDFNSLYPSIIQEFNICFTTVKLDQRQEANESDLPPVPDSSVDIGILPQEIAKLVHSRRYVKNEMKKTDKNSQKYKQYDIRQLGLKLTANSMYGCLGFEGSRFCAKTLAAMITAKGREILESTRNIVENNGFAVIYGDTDSIMVNTNSIDLGEAKKIGNDIKRLINKSYKQLTLDIDGVYKKLLLLKKKKYAGLAIDLSNESRITKELKGLDIVRRDWSFLARETGDNIVNIILSSNDRDEMVERIRETLAQVREGIEQAKIPLEKFEILKKLTHRPEEYRDAKSQPHVLVALRLNQTKNANLRQNDIVKYIICDDGTGQAATQRAYARIEIEGNDKLKIDSNYYLAHQIHPVVSRLCEPIEEMDACQVAEALGLDGTHYRRRLIEQEDNEANDENAEPGITFNFNACAGLPIECPRCKHVDTHRSPITEKGNSIFAECSSCHYYLLQESIKIEQQIVKFLHNCSKEYSNSKYKCDDIICGYELDFPPVFKNEFGYPCTECSHGFFKPKYPIKRLFDQQNFILKIVNFAEWEAKEATAEQKEAFKNHPKIDEIREYTNTWTKRVSRIVAENPYNRVDLSMIFAPMKLS